MCAMLAQLAHLERQFGTAAIAGWVFYTRLVPVVVQRAFQPLTVRHPPSSSASADSSSTGAPAQILPVPMVAGRTPQELTEQRRAESQAAAFQRQKDRAWLASYSAPASCEHPVDWKAQVECGNLYMRAKKQFEKQWLMEHPSAEPSGGTVVLDNGSIGGVRK